VTREIVGKETGMKKLLAALGLSALITAPAMGADLARRPPPPAPVPVYFFSWTGCYVGGNAGGLWVNKELTGTVLGQSFSANTSSWVGGVQAGCNYQFAGGWVVGIQGDYDWTDAHADRTGIFFVNSTQSFSAKSVASVTGRVGYAWDRFLGYVKGGGAWERDNLTFTFPGVSASFDNTRSGWTIGVGGEYAFTNWLTGFVEYDYYDFGSRSDNVVCGPVRCFVGGPFSLPFDVKETKNVVKVGLNILFNAGGPARY
jgi:outer membrane immunogenic protein